MQFLESLKTQRVICFAREYVGGQKLRGGEVTTQAEESHLALGLPSPISEEILFVVPACLVLPCILGKAPS